MRNRMSFNAEACTATSLAVDAVCEAERLERKSLVLWRRPLKTLKYSILELLVMLRSLGVRLLDRRFLASLLILTIVYKMPGPHASYMQLCRKNMGFTVYWLGLGLLSSVGFGTGLHTFLLYLGPHIAGVTLAAYECQTLDFPAPPYPEQKICPKEPFIHKLPNTWEILSKVRSETMLWGVGTALGELPPYFMARAARLSGKNLDEMQASAGNLNLFDKSKLLVERVVLRIGFFGILLCASVPNPLFDLAGVACGHFLVPFWKFFVATLIGKAIFKSNIQQLIVIVAFSEDLVSVLIDAIGQVPLIGAKIESPIQSLLNSTKQRMHRKANSDDPFTGLSLVAHLFQLLALVIVAYFVVSMLGGLAQRRCKRLQLQKREKLAQERQTDKADNKNLAETHKSSPKIQESIQEFKD
ncbi:vacuole membrane protein 1 [Drosophila novamexicana]|uniref:vacuole membrane protein 1 n=1 Tax=Drosophila novamexicana TaxID=47314 RepID=UPI0011E59034|nr:vacuole membrane protein 1 [Drosophila novamexicana]